MVSVAHWVDHVSMSPDTSQSRGGLSMTALTKSSIDTHSRAALRLALLRCPNRNADLCHCRSLTRFLLDSKLRLFLYQNSVGPLRQHSGRPTSHTPFRSKLPPHGAAGEHRRRDGLAAIMRYAH